MYEKTKMTSRNQSRNQKKITMSAWQTWTPGYTRGEIRCLGGVTKQRANSLTRVNRAMRGQIQCMKTANNCLEACRTAFHLMTDCMDKLDRFIDHRICDM